jgi:hypothetical protein
MKLDIVSTLFSLQYLFYCSLPSTCFSTTNYASFTPRTTKSPYPASRSFAAAFKASINTSATSGFKDVSGVGKTQRCSLDFDLPNKKHSGNVQTRSTFRRIQKGILCSYFRHCNKYGQKVVEVLRQPHTRLTPSIMLVQLGYHQPQT